MWVGGWVEWHSRSHCTLARSRSRSHSAPTPEAHDRPRSESAKKAPSSAARAGVAALDSSSRKYPRHALRSVGCQSHPSASATFAAPVHASGASSGPSSKGTATRATPHCASRFRASFSHSTRRSRRPALTPHSRRAPAHQSLNLVGRACPRSSAELQQPKTTS